MTTAYFDASAFVKVLVDEIDSDLAATLWDASTTVVSNRLAYPEVSAALAAAHRAARLTTQQLDDTETAWAGYWDCVRPIDLTDTVARAAAQASRSYALGGADGVHLASAMAVAAADVVVVTWDRRLSAGASAAGLSVAP